MMKQTIYLDAGIVIEYVVELYEEQTVPQMGIQDNSPTPKLRTYTVTGGSQYCGHFRPVPEGSVRWYAQRASSMCMCMSP